MTEIERFDFEKIPLERPRQHQARVVSTELISAGTLQIALEPDAGKMFDFIPGQYLSVVLAANEDKGLSRELRPYSLWNHPSESEPATTIIRLIPGGRASTLFSSLAPGDPIAFVAPLGSFYLRRPLHPHLYFVATGTGLVPLRSMLRDMDKAGELSDRKTTLLFGVRSEDDFFGLQEFEALSDRYEGFSFVPTCSQPTERWAGARGRVTAHLKGMDLPIDSMQAYLCGNGSMIDDVVAMLENRGLNRRTRRIVYERYFD